ncbi:MAG: hypothetical protein K0Q50_1953 [Vampirovibrio sp.]|jgi:hypothetical protein|nr:hypothetical protein [Vampirovibrio sp.]
MNNYSVNSNSHQHQGVKAHSAKPKNQPQYRGDLSLIALNNEPPKVKKQSNHGDGTSPYGYGNSLNVTM